MPPVTCRPLAPGDSLEELTALLHRAYAELGAMGFNYTAVDQDARVTARRIEGNDCWVAVHRGRLVGTVTLMPRGPRPLPARHDGVRVAHLAQLAVDPALRGRGIGGRLMDLAEARARETGRGAVALDTAEGAVHLLRLYEARGYRVYGYHRWRGKTYRSALLEKRLS